MGLRASLPTDKALRSAFEEHYEPLVRLCALLATEPGIAEVLARESFVRIAARIGELSSDMVSPSLRGMAFNLWRSGFRRWGMIRRARQPGAPPLRTAHIEVDRFVDLGNVLGALPLRRRACLVLRFHEHWTEGKIAGVLGWRAGSVRRQTARALATLQKRLPGANVEDWLPEALGRQAPARVDDEAGWVAIEARLLRAPARSRSRHRLVVLSVVVATAAVAIGFYAVNRARSFPPITGPRIAFLQYVMTPGGGNANLVSMNPDGSDKRVLAQHVDPDIAPTWSGDGKRAAFFGNVGAPGLWVVDANGSNLTRLVPCVAPRCLPGDLGFSPDGTAIAFVRNFSVTGSAGRVGSSLELVGTEGGLPRVLCTYPRCGQGLAEPTWSPDGSRIAFSHWAAWLSGPLPDPGMSTSLMVVRPDGHGLRQITNLGCRSGGTQCSVDGHPKWSRDGSRVAFVSQVIPPGSIGSNIWHIAMVAPDGSGLATVTRCSDPVCPVMGPVWSPDGRSLAYPGTGERDIATIRLAGSSVRKVRTCNATICWGPVELAWSPDGRSFAFDGQTLLFSIRADGSGMRKLADGVAGGLAWLPPLGG